MVDKATDVIQKTTESPEYKSTEQMKIESDTEVKLSETKKKFKVGGPPSPIPMIRFPINPTKQTEEDKPYDHGNT